VSWYYLSPTYSQLNDDETGGRAGRQPKLKGSVTRAVRLPSWLRDRAIDKLPFYSNPYNLSNSDLGEVNDALNAAQKWASQSTQNKSSAAITVDVVTIGSMNRMEYMHTQQKTWASNTHSVRNVFIATEINTDNAIISNGGSCQELMKACQVEESSLQLENSTQPFISDEELCLGRRIGLAMGASVMRYRKITHALVLGSSRSNVKHGSNDESMADLKQYTINPLPNYLIITFDSAYYNTERLEECVGHGGENAPIVYAPFTSRENVNLSNKPPENTQPSMFSYPTNNTGVVFNKPALEVWIRSITCFSSKNDPSSAPTPIDYDSKAQELEHNFCKWMNAMAMSDVEASQRNDTFETAIRGALKISLSTQRDQADNSRNEFVYSSRYQAVSISDLFSIYSSTMHLLCKSSVTIERVPSGEEMLGYLIDRFQISSGGLSESASDAKSSCNATTSNVCSSNMVACANVSLQGLKDTI